MWLYSRTYLKNASNAQGHCCPEKTGLHIYFYVNLGVHQTDSKYSNTVVYARNNAF